MAQQLNTLKINMRLSMYEMKITKPKSCLHIFTH